MDWLKKQLKSLLNLKEWFAAFLLIFGLRSVVIDHFQVPTGSMVPTVLENEFIVVNKLAYHIRAPFSDYLGKENFPLWTYSQPKRHDIIVFQYPKQKSVKYLKRVIGLPGETIKVIGKDVFINNNKLDYKKLSPAQTNKLKEIISNKFTQNGVHFYNNGKYSILKTDRDNQKIYEATIPEGYYFVLGDNRDFSYDSRYWGFVKESYIIGKAKFIWLSWDKEKGSLRNRFGKLK